MWLRLDSRPTACSTSILILSSALMALGVVMVFSAGASLSAPPITERPLNNPALRQACFTGVGLVSMLMVGLCPYQSWRIRPRRFLQPVVILLLVTIGLLAAVLVIGQERHGARRWLSLGPAAFDLGFQPSEIAKVALVLFLAAVCAHCGRQRVARFFSGLLPLALLLLGIAGLVGKEDLGTGALLLAVGWCLLWAAGARLWQLLLVCVPAFAGIVYLIYVEPYRLDRVRTFLDPFADAQDKGYHQVQSLITIASGGWWGRGLGAGIQKYGYLPEARSDFIFAVICEELGLIGGIAVIALFAMLLWHGRKAMVHAETDFGRLLALGVTLMIGLQAAMNMAVVTVSIPTKGIGLPLVSAGGTGVIFFGILIGLLANVARRPLDAPTVAEFPDPSPHRIPGPSQPAGPGPRRAPATA